ncbi:Gfo/Idh/MocA family protein [Alicyclobacillus pomorum]|uniref:Gfo/Idh/MocA family protein n=1 Tax=Alicyclobacillus pomorum TaxID=204470 RepID=UPI0004249A49|nr:Gfo/Idh/MocA family oxidoreductase [Alicyclobacillus pomorum]
MTVRVGVIGTGSISRVGHLPHYRNHPEVELVAVADVDPTRAEKVAAEFGAARWYANPTDMFDSERLDAVSICTANNSHVPLALMAFEHGADVLVEKPLATDLAAARQLADAATKHGRICMVGMTHRFRNDAQALKRFVEAGDLGDLYAARAQILRRRGTPAGWFTNRAVSGGGPLMDIGVHVLDLAWWLAGMPVPETVSGHLVTGIGRYNTVMSSRWRSSDAANQDNGVFDVEDYASAYIRFKNGLVLQLEVSWALNGPQDDNLKVDLYGTKGGVSLDPLTYYSERNDIFLDSSPSIERNDPYEAEIHHFVEAVKTRTQPLIPVEQGVSIVEMLTAIVASAERRREVVLG